LHELTRFRLTNFLSFLYFTVISSLSSFFLIRQNFLLIIFSPILHTTNTMNISLFHFLVYFYFSSLVFLNLIAKYAFRVLDRIFFSFIT
jgi:hypothetical protein